MIDTGKVLVVFSGGQDSTTCLAWALREWGPGNVEALSFNYGQRHAVELAQATRIIEELAREGVAVHHTILSIPLMPNSAMNDKDVEVKVDGGHNNLPTTFLPGRNAAFLALAAAYASSRGISEIVTGVCQTDYSGYPDCRQVFIEAMQLTLSLAMDARVQIHAPLMYLTKKQTVLLAKDLGAMHLLAHSHTCYLGKRPGCGTCPACTLRLKGFAEAGLEDPQLAAQGH